MPKSKSIRTVALIGLIVLAAAACTQDKKPTPGTSGNPVPSASSSSSSAESEAPVTGQDLHILAAQAAPGTFAFDTAGVEQLTVGDVNVTFTNSDGVAHEVRIIRVLDGSLSNYRGSLLSAGVAGVASLGQEVSVLGPIEAGKTASTTVTLEAGTYVLADFSSTDDGTPYAAHGMLRALTVSAR
jgi:plastocyanin